MEDIAYKLSPRSFKSVVEGIERSADFHAEKIAARYGGETINYHELNRRANIVAWRLIDAGARQGDLVALCVAPGIAMPIGVLAIIKAGCAYAPISTRDPPARRAFMVANAGAAILLTDQRPAARASEGLLTLQIDGLVEGKDYNPGISRDGDDIAYILHTSGSTGAPKAVMVPHSALTHYLRWHIDELRRDTGQLDLPLSSSICFAAGVTQLFTPLLLGRTLHIFDHDMVRQPERLFGWYVDHPDFGLYCVPTLWGELVRFAEAARLDGRNLISPRAVLLSGEAPREQLVARSFALWPGLRLWNLYGPTEATANATAGEILPGKPITLGRPIADTTILLTDASMAETLKGEIGEICIAGPAVARGYRNLPEQTAERFFVRRDAQGREQRVFRTGDYARSDSSGALVFVGRRDLLVKVRGHRIECGEIEAALLAHPTVAQAAVLCIGEVDPELAAYVVLKDAALGGDRIRAHLLQRLPDYMVPACVIPLDRFPLLANGKIDRNALPKPGRLRPQLSYACAPAADARETALVGVWERALDITGVGVNDDFFDLGGNSLTVTRARALIREELGWTVSFSDFFAHPTPRGIAALAPQTIVAGLSPVPGAEAPGRCHANQESLWLLEQTFPGQTAYTMQFVVRLDGILDPAVLLAALDDVLRRHVILRSVIRFEGTAPRLRVADFAAVLPMVDVGDEDEWRLRVSEARDLPFDLANGPLIRFALHRFGATSHRLVVTVHHLVFDGRSIGVFFDELIAAHEARVAGVHSPESSGRGYAEWVAGCGGDGEADNRGRAFWRAELGDCPQLLDLPTEHPRAAVHSFSGGVVDARIDADLAHRLHQLGRSQRATLFMTMLAAFDLLLYRHSGQLDFAVGVPVANREDPNAARVIGYLANTLAMRCRIVPEGDFRALLAETRRSIVAALEHQSLPFAQVARWLPLERQTSHTPLFQTMFALHETIPARQLASGLIAEAREEINPAAKFDLVLEGHVEADGIALRLIYNSSLFTAAGMERLLGHYLHILEETTSDPTRALDAYPLVPVETIREVTYDWNDTRVSHGEQRGLHRLFERQAAATPDLPAISGGGSRLTYTSLDRRANQVARYLAANGATEGATIGIQMEPGINMVVAMLAILKLGAAYVPLDPAYPAERLNYMIDDSGVAIVLGAAPRSDTPPQGPALLSLEADSARIEALADDGGVAIDVAPETLAYVIYTSGSSGKPKGVMVPHAGLAITCCG